MSHIDITFFREVVAIQRSLSFMRKYLMNKTI